MAVRYALIDGIRGLAIVNMIVYHAVWDLVYLYGFEWAWYLGLPGALWQQAICWTFILVSGFCLPLSSHPLQRGVEVSLAGLAVTMVTLVLMPQAFIVFGVLTCIGACMILLGLARPLLDKLRPVSGLAALGCFLLFLLSRPLPDGYLGIGDWVLVSLDPALYANLLTTFFGFLAPEFYSADYFPLFPWLFLFATGYFLYQWLAERGRLHVFIAGHCRFLEWAGRYSLWIYLLHQPVLAVLLGMIF